jgi:hypothetical protein
MHIDTTLIMSSIWNSAENSQNRNACGMHFVGTSCAFNQSTSSFYLFVIIHLWICCSFNLLADAVSVYFSLLYSFCTDLKHINVIDYMCTCKMWSEFWTVTKIVQYCELETLYDPSELWLEKFTATNPAIIVYQCLTHNSHMFQYLTIAASNNTFCRCALLPLSG